ncbi:NUDIX hydrolase [Hydrogenophaga sp.]|uniref:NUDIX hydrolase n=1 Tax=Hydrogenophaga sp. TaxID=1904254 RepID=UPI002717C261|nr:NUDIX hydrolase [Hydrogenophaga sp.]MDO9434000.1 NUDIX hydrolase [Hydrogenophaga sp.]
MNISFVTDEVLTPPVNAATVMVLRDGLLDLEVLMVRRHGDSGVLGGVHVFPGGKMDPDDLLVDASTSAVYVAACQIALHEDGLAAPIAFGLHVAALRETFEESGLLLGVPQGVSKAQAVRDRTAGGEPFTAALQALGLPLAATSVVPWSRWITPRRPAMMSKRFDTRFFVAEAPDGQVVEHCVREATEAVWHSPRVWLERYWAGEVELAPPQIMSLCHLAGLRSVAEALSAARSRHPALIEPQSFMQGDERVLCYPGDPAHSVAERAWPGPTRVVLRNRRCEPDGGLAALLGT